MVDTRSGARLPRRVGKCGSDSSRSARGYSEACSAPATIGWRPVHSSAAALARRHPRVLDPAVRLTRGLLTWRTIQRTIDSASAQHAFRVGSPLPRGFGIGMTERVVELPWLFAKRPSGIVLDAGSTLNHKPILDRILPTVTALHIVTLGPEKRSFPERGVSYLYADIRELPYASGASMTSCACRHSSTSEWTTLTTRGLRRLRPTPVGPCNVRSTSCCGWSGTEGGCC